jgi:phytoene dehydrogenase-like protein
VIVGAGPNGLAAAITLAREGRKVLVLEAKETPGGGARTEPLTLPGFAHDFCSAVHPMAAASPFFRSLPLEEHGLRWVHAPIPLAHPLDDGTAAALHTSLDRTAEGLRGDGPAYRRMMAPWVARWEELFAEILQPLHLPRHPLLMAGFGLRAVQSAESLANRHFREPRARALFAGLVGHSFLPFSAPPSSAIALVLAVAGHAVGWPFPRGGSGALTAALVRYLESLGGEVRTRYPVGDQQDLPPSRAVLFDTSAAGLARLGADQLRPGYRRALEKFRPGPATFKLDWALSAPIPWTAPECREAGTLHLGGSFEELAESEAAVARGESPRRPYLLCAQPSLFDPTRAPDGRHTAWAYCHLPLGNEEDLSERIELQVERFAPGFRKLVLARRVTTPRDFAAHNPNLEGGDISGGLPDLRQAFFRPMIRWNPYRTSRRGWYLCSAATPPGAGVHGMCGYHAAREALRDGL